MRNPVPLTCSLCGSEVVTRTTRIGDLIIEMQICIRGGDGHHFSAVTRPAVRVEGKKR